MLGKERVAAVPIENEQALREAESLITHLQVTTEADKAKLARKLHDELGGLMVSALMDLGSVQQLQHDINGPARQRLDRVKETLEAAIDLKRRVIEELRPSILDNFGLFAALRWHLRRLYEGSNILRGSLSRHRTPAGTGHVRRAFSHSRRGARHDAKARIGDVHRIARAGRRWDSLDERLG